MSFSKLMRFVGDNPKEWHYKPFSVKIKKTTWSAATDGEMLFAFKKKIKDIITPVDPDYPKDAILDLLSHEPPSSTQVSIPQLKKWAGRVPRINPPKDKDVYLEDCGNLMGVAIDRRKLAYLLGKVNISTAHAWVYGLATIVFESPNGQWRAFLAGYKDKPEPELVVFDSKSKEETIMDLMEMVDQS